MSESSFLGFCLGFSTNLSKRTATLESNEVLRILGLIAHCVGNAKLSVVSVHVGVHVPANFLCGGHSVAEFLLWLLLQGVQLSFKHVHVIAFKVLAGAGGLICDGSQILGVEVEVLIQVGMLFFFAHMLAED